MMGPSSLLRIRINSYTFGTPDASGTKDVFFYQSFSGDEVQTEVQAVRGMNLLIYH
jgi:hypothetical protein